MTGATEINPLVSIGVPVYNGEKFLREALRSLQEQTYKNLEIVISDNASTDRTAEICKELAARDRRIRYYRNSWNIGCEQNFRRVFQLSSGEYFMWAGADDTRPPTAVEKCLESLLKNTRAVMVHGIVLVKRDDRESPRVVTNEADLSQRRAAERIAIFTKKITYNAMLYGMYRRWALEKGTLALYLRGQDYLLCLQMCLLGPVEYVPAPILVYRETTSVRVNNRMYHEMPITMRNLLTIGVGKNRKCWTVLIGGCYFLATIKGVGGTERIGGIIAHVSNFGWLWRTRLAKEILFQLFTPLAWLNSVLRHLLQRSPLFLRLARRLSGLMA